MFSTQENDGCSVLRTIKVITKKVSHVWKSWTRNWVHCSPVHWGGSENTCGCPVSKSTLKHYLHNNTLFGSVARRKFLSTSHKMEHPNFTKHHWNYYLMVGWEQNQTLWLCTPATCLGTKWNCIQGKAADSHGKIYRWIIDIFMLFCGYQDTSTRIFQPKSWLPLPRGYAHR